MNRIEESLRRSLRTEGTFCTKCGTGGGCEHTRPPEVMRSSGDGAQLDRSSSTAYYDSLAHKYNMREVEPHGNEKRAHEVVISQPGTPHGSAHVRIADFGGWHSIHVGYGEVRHDDSQSRTPYASHGMIDISSAHKQVHDPRDPCGSAVPGNELVGLKHRIGAVAPMSRTSVGLPPHPNRPDYYTQDHDIVQHALSHHATVGASSASPRDPSVSGLFPGFKKAKAGY